MLRFFFFFIGLGGHKPTIIDVVENRLQRLVHKKVRVIPQLFWWVISLTVLYPKGWRDFWHMLVVESSTHSLDCWG